MLFVSPCSASSDSYQPMNLYPAFATGVIVRVVVYLTLSTALAPCVEVLTVTTPPTASGASPKALSVEEYE